LPEKLEIAPTKTTLGIKFNPETRILGFEGKSYPTNPITFFQPILDWVRVFLEESVEKEITLEFRVNYFNTSSSTYLFKVLELFDAAHKQKMKVKVLWYYLNDDEDSLESGKSLLYDLDLPVYVVKEA